MFTPQKKRNVLLDFATKKSDEFWDYEFKIKVTVDTSDITDNEINNIENILLKRNEDMENIHRKAMTDIEAIGLDTGMNIISKHSINIPTFSRDTSTYLNNCITNFLTTNKDITDMSAHSILSDFGEKILDAYLISYSSDDYYIKSLIDSCPTEYRDIIYDFITYLFNLEMVIGYRMHIFKLMYLGADGQPDGVVLRYMMTGPEVKEYKNTVDSQKPNNKIIKRLTEFLEAELNFDINFERSTNNKVTVIFDPVQSMFVCESDYTKRLIRFTIL